MNGMFNYQNPQMLQQEYLQNMMVSPQQMSQLPLLNQVTAMGGNAGALVGTGIGRLFGGVTPQEAEQNRIQGLFGGASMTNPEELSQAAERFAQAGDLPRAQELQGRAQELQATQAAQAQAQAQEQEEQRRLSSLAQVVQNKTGLSPEESFALAQDPAAVREIMKSGKPIKANVDGRVKLFGEDGTEIADLGAAQDAGTRVNVNVDSRGAKGAIGLVKDFDSAVKEPLAAFRDAQTAKLLINESMGSNNSQAWEQARTLLAKATGQGRLSNEDIRRTGVDPRFVQGVADWFNKKTKGVPNADIQRQLYVVASALERQNGSVINETAERSRSIAEMEGVDPSKLNTFFPGVPVNNSPRVPQAQQGSGGGITSTGTSYRIVTRN